MMQQYRYSHMDNEREFAPALDEQGAYGRILTGIRRKGKQAAQEWDQKSQPVCPYKRADFARVWAYHFEAEAGVNISEPAPQIDGSDIPF